MRFFKTITFVALFLLSLQVFGHSKMLMSEPEDEAELTETPEQLVLVFNRKVVLARVILINAAEEPVDIGFKGAMERTEKFTITLPELAADTYQVKWTAMGGDGHKMKGAFGFTLASESAVN